MICEDTICWYQISKITKFLYTSKFYFFSINSSLQLGFPGGSMVKNLLVMQEMQEALVEYLGLVIPWRKKRQPTPVLLPGEAHGQRSLVGYSR